MEEPFTLFARECVRFAQEFHCSLSIFTWENRLDFRLNEPLDRIEQEVIRTADKIICGNQLAKKRITNIGADREKLFVLPQTGLDLELFKPIEEINKIFDLCYHGRMVREKGLPFLENVAKELNRSLLWVGGRGGYHPKWGDSKDWTNYEDLPGFINSAKIEVQIPFSYNDFSEQMNYASGEAMACELPVVCSDNGSIPENYTGSPAKIIPQGDPESLKNAILDLINDEEKRNKLGKEGREWVINNLSISVIAKRLLEILELI